MGSYQLLSIKTWLISCIYFGVAFVIGWGVQGNVKLYDFDFPFKMYNPGYPYQLDTAYM